LYENEDDFYEKLKQLILNLDKTIPVKNFVAKYDWSTLAPHYDEAFV